MSALGRSRAYVRRMSRQSYMHYLRQDKILCGWPKDRGTAYTSKVNLVTCPWCKDELDKK